GPQSGKTTLMRTLALSLALTHTPQEVGVYGLALAESRQPTPPASRAGSGQSAMVVAAALHGLGRRDEAEMMARQAVDECKQFLHPTHPRIREARDLLAQITAGDPPPEAPDAGAGSS
ncbi:FtsK/SpoIIIE domain-containing protein, partial [Streptomyces sp. NPDC004362]|uniref:tetratricopeptide repeat protein n=1 Tax=Streptomyces sp. NPDC004362 TaxID=3154456 RepID=UPI0033B99D30